MIRIMQVRPEMMPFALIVWGLWLLVLLALWWTVGLRPLPVWTGICVFLTAFLCFFFRDPDRKTPETADAIISGADGIILGVQTLREDQFLKTDAICISVFLSLWDVHVTRAPITGVIREAAYVPGKAIPAYKETSSQVNR